MALGRVSVLPNLLAASLGCGCSSGCTSTIQTVGDAGDATPRLLCPSDSAVVADLPTGPCIGTGNCVVTPDATCRPGVKAVGSSVFLCECASGAWSCTVIGGGFNLTICPDNGLDDGGADGGG
jgi:hypothetical protein